MTNNHPSDVITRCPSCHTAFKATGEILTIAGGTVRCGSCLRIFNAYDHIDKISNTPQADHSTSSQPTPKEDESWALELLRQEEQDSKKPETAPQTSADTTLKNNETDSAFIDIINNDLQSPEVTQTQDSSITDETTHQKSEDLGSENSKLQDIDDDEAALLENITLDPLIFQEEKKHKPSLLWISGIVLLSFALLIQAAWIRFDTLSIREPYRSAYSTACRILNCQLPALSDIRKIRTTQLVVRSHPSQERALQVDAIILNDANFDQLFPNLRLEFLNIQNEPVASRDFQPHEYLQGELTGITLMPAQQPIQLALAIVDPGEKAVNYRIVIIKPAP